MNLQSVCLCVGMWRYCRSSTADGLSGISPSFINFSCPFVLVQTTVARDGAELDLLCLETLSVTLALSSEMLSLTSLTYDSSSEPCEGNRYTGEWGSAVVQHKQIRTASHSHTRVHCSLPLANKLQQHAGYLSHCSNHESRHCSIHTLYIANKIRSHLKGPCCSHFGWKLLFQFMWQKKERKGLPLELQARGDDEFPRSVILQHGSMHAWGATMLDGSSGAIRSIFGAECSQPLKREGGRNGWFEWWTEHPLPLDAF